FGLQPLTAERQRVFQTPLVKLPLGSVSRRITSGVADEAIGVGLYQRRSAARPRSIDGADGCLADIPDSHPIDGLCLNPKGPRALEDAAPADGRGQGVLHIEVVLTDEQDR